MDGDTRELLRSSLAHLLAETSDRPLSRRLVDMGWEDVLADDAVGAGLLLFEAKGDGLGRGDALGPVLSRSLSRALARPELAGASVILPASLNPDRPSSTLGGGRLTVRGFVTSPPEPGAGAVTPLLDDAGHVRLVVLSADLTGDPLPVGGTDPDLGLLRVEAVLPETDGDCIDADWSATAWTEAVAAGRWALGAELVGVGRHVVAEAVRYAGDRRQYGRPIGTFQAVQHRLASAHATVVGASHVVEEAAASGSAWSALVAKALSGRAAEESCTQAQQVFGAIGFTWEHPFHRYLRRAYVLDRLLGDWRSLEAEIGNRLQAGGVVTRIGEL